METSKFESLKKLWDTSKMQDKTFYSREQKKNLRKLVCHSLVHLTTAPLNHRRLI